MLNLSEGNLCLAEIRVSMSLNSPSTFVCRSLQSFPIFLGFLTADYSFLILKIKMPQCFYFARIDLACRLRSA